MRVEEIMMAIFCEDNKRKIVSITNNCITFEDGEVKPLSDGIKEYHELIHGNTR